MPLVSCPDCSREISPKAYQCPHCGLPRRRGFRWGVRIGVALLVALVLYITLMTVMDALLLALR